MSCNIHGKYFNKQARIAMPTVEWKNGDPHIVFNKSRASDDSTKKS
jgi:hypothetical protein